MSDIVDDFYKKAKEVIEDVGGKLFGQGMAGEAHENIKKHYNEIDRVNRELENTSPNDTESTHKIFE